MPRRLEQLLDRRANALEREGKLRDRGAYVYGTLARIQNHHHSPMQTGDALRSHMLGEHREPPLEDRRRNETAEQNRHLLLHQSPMPAGDALRSHMLGPHHEPPSDDRRRNETAEVNRHFWLHYGTTGRADHDHAGRAS